MAHISRRRLLQQASGGVALVTALRFPSAIKGLTATSKDSSAARTRECFDFGWRFFQGDAPGAQSPDFSDAGWQAVDLPHDWSIEGPISEKESSGGSGGYVPTGIGWYRKSFDLQPFYKDKKILIEFDGVYQNSEVWINGHFLGKRPYGYIPFFYDLTPHLAIGQKNVVAVKVDNSRQPSCRWYSGSGIYRHTWFLATNRLHVAYWGTFVTAPRISKDAATVQIKTMVENDSEAGAVCTLVWSVLDEKGNDVQSAKATQEIDAKGAYEFVQQTKVENPTLWSVENPYLYISRVTVRVQDRILDSYDTPFGIREAVFDADKGFLLNGSRLKLNGVCLHHDAGCVGAAVPERVWERRLGALREMGCNAIRTSHNPYSAEFLDLCDRMGFLVMNEVFDEWKVPKGQIRGNGYSNCFDEWYERDVTNFVHRDRNHPSVVLWSAGNEVGDQSAPGGAETLRKLLDVFHREDPTRPVTVGCDQIMSEPPSNAARPEFLLQLDIVGYNYVDRWRDRIEKYYSIDKQAFPGRRFIGTESGSMGGIRGEYGDLFPGTARPAFGGFARSRNIDVEQLWKFVSTYDYIAGDFMWTGIDYLGEAFWPAKSASSGVIDTCGFKKDGAYFYQSQWTQKPVLHVFPHWNWEGKEGQFIAVTCYTNCDTVELFLNGKSVGVKGYAFPRLGMEGRYGNYPTRARVLRTTADLHLVWDVPYEPGVLNAVGTKNGEVVSTVEISTTGAPAAIDLSADRDVIFADRRDVAHIIVKITDDRGRIVPIADNELTFDVEGEGKLIGVDNGNPSSHESYKSNRRKAFNGLCLAIVQSTATPGRVRVTATSPSLKSDAVAITTTGIQTA
jgi:beta-galactosidase